ncbi:M23 family metallopeptidase [Marivita sp. S6314]|uniref:M23 family metallopeptidase n=1 Tax=Marivita sp. S6314 TaxID=2926406 RepID=UPI001FF37571|nr:M23 family metallopeptidase [Marivita sp. S6314]MCK0150404.1 M23 family metallopeptidase [Marivita sp. S6314]
MRLFHLVVFGLNCCLGTALQAEVTCDTQYGMVCIETVATSDTVTFYAENRHSLLPVTLSLDMNLTNLERKTGKDGAFVLSGQERIPLFVLQSIRSGPWRYNYEFSWSRGDITARHTDTYRYRLPFETSSAVVVGQGCNGRFSHLGAQRYAVDFMMQIGTPILAARDGRVVDIKEDSNRGGPDRYYEADGNYVIVQHDDRTLAQYFHLQKNGASVRLGQSVKRGDLLGYSGNTGRSTGPHLHFDVVTGSTGIESQTVPVTFATPSGEISCPRQGARLTATH